MSVCLSTKVSASQAVKQAFRACRATTPSQQPGALRRSTVPCSVSRRDTFLIASLALASGTPAALANTNTLDDEFLMETRNLADAINQYMSLDPFDKERIKALNYIKSEGKTWIARHARGGSAPGQAAKRMYVAVDAVIGHLTANGAAPLPAAKVRFVRQTLNEVEGLLEQGK